MRIALLGRTKLLYDCIDKFIENGHEIVLIGTCSAAPEYSIKEKDFERAASRIGAFYFNNVRINSNEIVDILKKAQADVAISVNWITVIKEEAIRCFRYGIINAHCGDLPKYRGNACPNWALLNEENSYGLCIHYMIPGELDSGNILVKRKYPITDETNITDIYSNLEKEVPEMFCEAIGKIESGDYEGQKQSTDPMESLRCYPRMPRDSFIDFSKDRKQVILEIRASAKPFQGAYFYWNDLKIYIFEAKEKPFEAPCCVYPGQVMAIDKKTGMVDVAVGDGVIQFDRVVIEGNEVKASDIICSTRTRLNYSLPDEIYTLRREIDLLKNQIERLEAKQNKKDD